MKKYEYQFIHVSLKQEFRMKRGETFEQCKEIIVNEASKGWRLKQVVIQANEKTGVASPYCYEIIFEREIEDGKARQ